MAVAPMPRAITICVRQHFVDVAVLETKAAKITDETVRQKELQVIKETKGKFERDFDWWLREYRNVRRLS